MGFLTLVTRPNMAGPAARYCKRLRAPECQEVLVHSVLAVLQVALMGEVKGEDCMVVEMGTIMAAVAVVRVILCTVSLIKGIMSVTVMR